MALRGSQEFPIDSGVATLRLDGSLLSLLINGVESSCVDLQDPSHLDFEYMQHMTVAIESSPNWLAAHSRRRALHLGGAGCALPRAWAHLFPTWSNSVVEMDAALAELARKHCDIPRAPAVKIRVGEARAVVSQSRPGAWDVVIRDAFVDGIVPNSLRSGAFTHLVSQCLADDGIYLLNCAHGGGSDARSDALPLLDAFEQVIVVADPKVGRGGRRGNVVVIATRPRRNVPVETQAPQTSKTRKEAEPIVNMIELDRNLRRLPLPARAMSSADMRKWLSGAQEIPDPTEPS